MSVAASFSKVVGGVHEVRRPTMVIAASGPYNRRAALARRAKNLSKAQTVRNVTR